MTIETVLLIFEKLSFYFCYKVPKNSSLAKLPSCICFEKPVCELERSCDNRNGEVSYRAATFVFQAAFTFKRNYKTRWIM